MTTSPKFVAVALAELRAKTGLTQQALADAVGVHRVAVARWESGVRVPSLDVLPILADALGVSVVTVAKKIAEAYKREATRERAKLKGQS